MVMSKDEFNTKLDESREVVFNEAVDKFRTHLEFVIEQEQESKLTVTLDNDDIELVVYYDKLYKDERLSSDANLTAWLSAIAQLTDELLRLDYTVDAYIDSNFNVKVNIK